MAPSQYLNSWRDGGHLRGLRGLPCAVLMVYVSRSDWRTAEAYPSVKSIARDVGEMNLNRVRRAIEKLVSRGLLELVKPGGGKGRSAVMRLALPTGGGDELSTLAITRDIDPPPQPIPISAGQGGVKRGPPPTPYGDGFVAQTGTDLVPPTIQNLKERLGALLQAELERLTPEEQELLKMDALAPLGPLTLKHLQAKHFSESPTLAALMIETLRKRQERSREGIPQVNGTGTDCHDHESRKYAHAKF